MTANEHPLGLELGAREQTAGFAGHVRKWGRNTFAAARKYPLGAFGAVVILLLLVVAAVPDLIATHSYSEIRLSDRLQSPSRDHFFGTDDQGRDTFSRVVFGAQTSVFISFGTVLLSSVIASLLGVLSAYWGSWFDLIVQRVVDIWMAFPGLLFLIFLVSIFGNSRLTLIIVLGILIAASSSRIIRSAALSVLNRPFIEAARTTGAGGPRIVLRHIMPNIVAVIIVTASVQVGAIIIIESSLSFLGYGIPPPIPSWGRMLQSAQALMYHQPLLAVVPGVAIVITVYAFNVLGDALRDAMDPRLRGMRE